MTKKTTNCWLFVGKSVSFTFGEGRLHLGNTKKNEFSFGISLGLHYLCTRNEDTKRDIKDTDAAGIRHGHPLLDVPWRGLADHLARHDRRDGLDMDAAVVSLRHTSSDVSWLALATNAGAVFEERGARSEERGTRSEERG